MIHWSGAKARDGVMGLLAAAEFRMLWQEYYSSSCNTVWYPNTYEKSYLMGIMNIEGRFNIGPILCRRHNLSRSDRTQSLIRSIM